MQANVTYDILINTFKNTAIGLCCYWKPTWGTAYANATTYNNFWELQIKNSNNIDETINYTSALLKLVNAKKLPHNTIIGESSAENY